MKRAIVIIILLGMVGWAVYDFIKDSNNTAQTEELSEGNESIEEDEVIGLEKGNVAPDFELKTLDGETVSLSDFRGEKVFLNFWATWCPPCRAEIPDMQKFHENTDVVILAVNLTDTESSKKNVPKFMEEYGITFTVLLDEDSNVANLYDIQPIPTTYLIDSTGKIQNMAFGALTYESMIEGFEMMD